MRVTIGLPVFDAERYLERTLESLLAQTLSDFELVVTDNASTDGTDEICRRAAARDGRIRYHRSDVNRGAAWNYNHAFELSSSPYFKWAAADDLCAPTFLARCVDALDADSGASLAYPRTRLIDDNGDVVRDHDDGLALDSSVPHERLRRLVASLGYAHPAYGVIRADALRKTRLLGAYPSSDYVLLAELALTGRFVEVPERLFFRRLHPQMMSRDVHSDAEAATAAYDPQARTRFRAESWRLCAEHFVAIAGAPLPALERLRCGLVFAEVGGRRYADRLALELVALVRSALRPTALRS